MSPEIEKHRLQADALISGRRLLRLFVRTAGLVSDPPKVTFHDKQRKRKLKTFGDFPKKMKVRKGTNKEVIIKADRALFARMIIFA